MKTKMQLRLDRRHQRSSRTLDALAYQLEDTARRNGVDSLVLADRDGLKLAGGGRCEDVESHEEVASLCPLVVKEGGNCYDGEIRVPGDRDLSVLLFRYRGQVLYLAAVTAGVHAGLSDAMLHAMSGVLRILG